MLKEISNSEEEGVGAGRVSTGFMHATPGEMKSLRSSAERIALMVAVFGSCGAFVVESVDAAVEARWGNPAFENFETQALTNLPFGVLVLVDCRLEM